VFGTVERLRQEARTPEAGRTATIGEQAARGHYRPYCDVADSSRSFAQSTRSRHMRRLETVIFH
jgi:hypothetical protein